MLLEDSADKDSWGDPFYEKYDRSTLLGLECRLHRIFKNTDWSDCGKVRTSESPRGRFARRMIFKTLIGTYYVDV